MDKNNRIVLGLCVATLLIAAGLFIAGTIFGSYYEAPDEAASSKIVLGEIPLNAKKVNSIDDVSVPFNGVIYGTKQQVGFVSVPVYDIQYFKTNQLDEVYVSLNTHYLDKSGFYGYKGIISLKGINYSKLPNSYDYQEEVDIKPLAQSTTIISEVKVNWHERDEQSLNKENTWVLTVRHFKDRIDKPIMITIVLLVAAIIIIAGLIWVVARAYKRSKPINS